MSGSYQIRVVFLAALFAAVSCSLQSQFLAHTSRVARKNFPCAVPQKRVVYLKELVSEEEWNDKFKHHVKDLAPPATILRRCGGSGCCDTHDQRCSVKKQKEVKLIFADFAATPIKYHEVLATDHVVCSCDRINMNEIKK